jgi:hypothetical protein
MGGNFSPPIIGLVTDNGKKIIEKRDGGLEIYDLQKDMWENHNLAGELKPEILTKFYHLLEFVKQDTGYLEALAYLESHKQDGDEIIGLFDY